MECEAFNIKTINQFFFTYVYTIHAKLVKGLSGPSIRTQTLFYTPQTSPLVLSQHTSNKVTRSEVSS